MSLTTTARRRWGTSDVRGAELGLATSVGNTTGPVRSPPETDLGGTAEAMPPKVPPPLD